MEAGGLNLYRMAGNSAVNKVDHLGLFPWPAIASSIKPQDLLPGQGLDTLDDPKPMLDEPKWNDASNNCYNYATCTPRQYPNNKTQPGQFKEPYRKRGSLPSPEQRGVECGDLEVGLESDYGGASNIKNADANGECPPGYYKIRMWVAPGGGDFHFMRQANDGEWYEKVGENAARQVPDPTKHKDYKECPYDKCIPCGGPQIG